MQFGEIGAPAPDGSPGGAPGPLFIRAPCCGDNFQCRDSTWRISCEKSSLSLWIYRNAVPTFFSHLMHGSWKGWEKFPPRLNLRINFPKFFPHRVFSGNLGVEPSERFHICSNIGNPPASLLFSNGFHI